ncbi:MAG: LptF/LptG family permease [Rickettsiaceae bacterium]|nr:LptF/LptG family permease [Rickettsiaceae bacterium]
MFERSILTLYLSRLFTKIFILVSFLVLIVIMIAVSFEILYVFKNHYLAMKEFWLLVIYKIPHIFNEVMLLISLVTTTLFVQMIVRNNELLIIISSGITINKVLVISSFLSLIFGIFIVSINGSLAPYFLNRYHNLESKIFNNKNLNLMVSQTGIFFSEQFGQEKRIVQVRSIDIEKSTLEDLTILITNLENDFIERIDSKEAILESGFYKIKNVTINSSYQTHGTHSTYYLKNLRLPTNLQIENLKDRFYPPKMIKLWDLPKIIKKFRKSGLVITQYQLYYYKQLLQPLGMVAMSLIAYCFINLNLRDQINNYMFIASLMIGLIIFFLKGILVQFLAYNGFMPLIANVIPIITIILLTIFVV